MLTLASMIYVAYMWCQETVNMKHGVPMPVTIETGELYSYNDIDSAIYVPHNWNDSCYNQRQVILDMLYHFNNFRNGNNKMKQDTMIETSRKWVCVTDDAK